MSVGVMVEMKVEDIAKSIKRMSPADKEMLLLILSGEDKEIARRLKDIRSKKVKPLTREETFRDVL